MIFFNLISVSGPNMETVCAYDQIARSTLPDLRQLVQTCILFFAPLTFTATFWTLEFQILLQISHFAILNTS